MDADSCVAGCVEGCSDKVAPIDWPGLHLHFPTLSVARCGGFLSAARCALRACSIKTYVRLTRVALSLSCNIWRPRHLNQSAAPPVRPQRCIGATGYPDLIVNRHSEIGVCACLLRANGR